MWAIDTAGRDGGYIMDASALLMDDASVENVNAMIDLTLDYGVYSQATNAPGSLEQITRAERPAQQGISIPVQRRQPGVYVTWEQKRAELPPFQADEAQARKAWERVDSLGYTFCWVSLTW